MSLVVESLRLGKALLQTVGGRPARQVARSTSETAELAIQRLIQQSSRILGAETAETLEKNGASAKQIADTLAESLTTQTAKATLQKVAEDVNEGMALQGGGFKLFSSDDPNWATLKVVDDIWAANVEQGLVLSKEDREYLFTHADTGEGWLGSGLFGAQSGDAAAPLGGGGAGGVAAMREAPQGSSLAYAQHLSFSRQEAREFVRIMKEGRHARGGDTILKLYIENLLQDSALQRVSHLPAAVERKLYYDICRSVLQILELGLAKLHNFDLVGHSVQVDLLVEPSRTLDAKAVEEMTRTRQLWTRMNKSRVEMVVSQIIEEYPDVQKFAAIAPELETQFVATVAQVSMRLLTDLFCDERIRVRVLGHQLRWTCDPMSTDQIERMCQNRKGSRPRVNQDAIVLFVDELLKDEEVNLLWVPDMIEAEIYKHALTTVICMLEDVLSGCEITVLGLEFHFSLTSALVPGRSPWVPKNGTSCKTSSSAEGEGATSSNGSCLGSSSTTTSTTGKNTQSNGDASASFASGAAPSADASAEARYRRQFSERQLTLYVTPEQLKARLAEIHRETAAIENLLDKKQTGGPAGVDSSNYTRPKAAGARRPAEYSASGELLRPALDPESEEDAKVGDGSSSSATPAAGAQGLSLADETKREFQKLAAQDRLARFLQVRESLSEVPLNIPYAMMRDVDGYKHWLPMCTSGEVLARDAQSGEITKCKVAFGIDTRTFLGVLGDNVTYQIRTEPPKEIRPGVFQARVVSDTGEHGFAYGDRLVYDWVFISENGNTEVSLNLFLQVNSSLYLPVWDALQKVLTEQMLQAFEKEARRRVALKGAEA
ncbi:unnamed protein product [Amoebophrya sp. A25]|nr:unnamed protein product [Amoebophrya sp. A25]|eukprot:GSA25T00020709001.1